MNDRARADRDRAAGAADPVAVDRRRRAAAVCRVAGDEQGGGRSLLPAAAARAAAAAAHGHLQAAGAGRRGAAGAGVAVAAAAAARDARQHHERAGRHASRARAALPRLGSAGHYRRQAAGVTEVPDAVDSPNITPAV